MCASYLVCSVVVEEVAALTAAEKVRRKAARLELACDDVRGSNAVRLCRGCRACSKRLVCV